MEKLLLLLCLCSLAGCETEEQIAKRQVVHENAQSQKCEGWGAKKGTPEYLQCREQLNQQDAEADNQRRQAMVAYAMANRQPAYVNPTLTIQPTYNPPMQRQVNCNSMRMGMSIQTNCY